MPPSAVLTRVEQSRGAWWSRSTRSESAQSARSEKALHRTTSEKSPNREPSPRNTLPGAIASVFGFKPKRVHNMPIQDPPSSLPTRPSPTEDRKLQRNSTRKSTKTRASVLTLPSKDAFDDVPTPHVASFREPSKRGSAFTIAEGDPYTSRRVLDSPSSSLSHNGRLSPAYVPSSSPVSRKDEPQTPPHSNRTSPISRASTSSVSQNSSASSSPGTSGKRALPGESAARKPSARRSPGGDDPRRPNLAGAAHHSMGSLLGISQRAHEEDMAVFVIPKSVSSSTLTEKFRQGEGIHAWTSHPELKSRPKTAQDSDPSTPTGFSRFRPAPPSPKAPSTPHSSPTSPDQAGRSHRPRVTIPSMSRPGPAPSAPPTATLPPTPFESDCSPTISLPSSFGSSAASSGVNDIIRDHHPRSGKEKSRTRQREPSTPRKTDIPANSGNGSPPASPSPSRIVRKTSSHNSLTRRIGSQSNVSPSSPSPAPPEDPHVFVKLQKHRSFHNTRMPRPPVPLTLRHASSFNPPGSQTAPLPTKPSQGSTDSHKTTTSSISTASKKRLFSTPSLRRPSTSTTIQALEDDVRSLFSIRSETPSMQSQAFPNAMSSTSSSPVDPAFWDEASQAQQIPISPAISAVAEYTPQRIMSPEDMLKVEASVMMETPDPSWLSDVYVGRSRTMSFGTISTAISEAAPSYMSPSTLSPPPPIRRGLERASAPPPGLPPGTPMWTGMSLVDHTTKSTAPSMIRPPTPHSIHPSHHGHAASLSSAHSSPFSNTCELPTALSPPPRSRPSVSFTPERSTPDLVTPLSPPPPRRPVQVVEARPALMRKPSFLDIEDGVDMHGPGEDEKGVHVTQAGDNKPVECSFLDFGGLESPRHDQMEEDQDHC